MLQFSLCRNVKLVKLKPQTWFCSLRTPDQISVDYFSLSWKFWELVVDREAWHAAVHGVAESDRTEWLNWTEVKAALNLPFVHALRLSWRLRKVYAQNLRVPLSGSLPTECSSLHFEVASVVSRSVLSSSGLKHGQFCVWPPHAATVACPQAKRLKKWNSPHASAFF